MPVTKEVEEVIADSDDIEEVEEVEEVVAVDSNVVDDVDVEFDDDTSDSDSQRVTKKVKRVVKKPAA